MLPSGIILDPLTSRVLVAQRNTQDIHYGKWEFPGGKIHPGEAVETALKRELNEELGIRVLSSEPFETIQFDYADRSVVLNFCLVTEYSGRATGLESQTISWVRLSELPQLEMLEANHPIIGKLLDATRLA